MDPRLKVTELSEETVRRLAQIIGPNSAAQQALDNAERERANGRTVRFLQAGSSLFVESAEPPAA